MAKAFEFLATSVESLCIAIFALKSCFVGYLLDTGTNCKNIEDIDDND